MDPVPTCHNLFHVFHFSCSTCPRVSRRLCLCLNSTTCALLVRCTVRSTSRRSVPWFFFVCPGRFLEKRSFVLGSWMLQILVTRCTSYFTLFFLHKWLDCHAALCTIRDAETQTSFGTTQYLQDLSIPFFSVTCAAKSCRSHILFAKEALNELTAQAAEGAARWNKPYESKQQTRNQDEPSKQQNQPSKWTTKLNKNTEEHSRRGP